MALGSYTRPVSWFGIFEYIRWYIPGSLTLPVREVEIEIERLLHCFLQKGTSTISLLVLGQGTKRGRYAKNSRYPYISRLLSTIFLHQVIVSVRTTVCT